MSELPPSTLVLSELRSSFQRQLPESPGGISADTLFTELGTDSLDTVELVIQLEEEFDINILDTAAEGFRTIGDLIRYLEEQRRRKGG